MTDREKVIKELEECLSASCRGFRTCPYSDNEWDAVETALALLREKEPVRFKVTQQRRSYPFWDAECEGCGYQTSTIHTNWKYCPECGRKVKWDD